MGSVEPPAVQALADRAALGAAMSLTPPASGKIPVAILISEGVNVIDFSGPWGVFSSVMIGSGGHENHQMPLKLFTVSDKAEIK